MSRKLPIRADPYPVSSLAMGVLRRAPGTRGLGVHIRMVALVVMVGCGGGSNSHGTVDGAPVDGASVDGASVDGASVDGASVDGLPPDSAMPAGFTVGGNVHCLRGAGLVLRNNGEDLPIAASGPFEFADPLDDGATYDVSVIADPMSPLQTCTIAGGAGTIAASSITDVTISCAGAPTTRVAYLASEYPIGGAVWLTTIDESGCPGKPVVIAGPPLGLWQLAFAAGGTKLVFDGDGTDDSISNAKLHVIDLTSSELATATFGGAGHVDQLSLSPNGERVVYLERFLPGNEHEVHVADVAGWPPSTWTAAPSVYLPSMIIPWASDGSRFLLNAGIAPSTGIDRMLLVDVAETGPGPITEVSGVLGWNRDVDQIALSPDGSRAAYVADQDVDQTFEVYLVDLSGATPGTPTKVSPPAPQFARALDPAFTPDGNGLVFRLRTSSTHLYYVDLAGPGVGTPTVLNDPFPLGGEITSAVISPDGRWVAFWSDPSGDAYAELFVVDISGSEPGVPQRVSPEGSMSFGGTVPWPLRFTVDGRWIIFKTNEVVPGIAPRVLASDVSGTTPVEAVDTAETTASDSGILYDVSPDGSRAFAVVFSGEDHARLYVADLSGSNPGPPVLVPTSGTVYINPVFPAFIANGDAILYTTRSGEHTNLEVAGLAGAFVDPVQQVNTPFSAKYGGVSAFDTSPLP